MDAIPTKTRLEALLFERNLGEAEVSKRTKIPRRRLNDKLRQRTQFTLPEMRAIQINLFPEMSLEEIFEGYGE